MLAVRRCSLTNMLDRPVVADLAEKLGFPDAARWIGTHPRDYAEGVFRGFEAEKEVGADVRAGGRHLRQEAATGRGT